MCIKEQFVYVERGGSYHKQLVPCGHCWACIRNRQNDLIGRCLCEVPISKWVHVLTLTYDDKRITEDPSKARVIHKSDFQAFMKRLRNKYPARFLVAGEYGKRKGRTHFHAVLFGQGEEPPASHFQEKKYYPSWPWGFVYSENPGPNANYKHMRYVAKYLTKAREKPKDGKYSHEWVNYSKQPLLGAKFFRYLAERYASERLVPYTLNYVPPGYTGNARFSMYGRAQFEFFDTLLHLWPEFHERPKNEWVDRSYQRYLRYLHNRRWDALTASEQTAALAEHLRTREARPLTQHEKMQYGYRKIDEAFRWQKVPEAEKERLRALQEETRRLSLELQTGEE